jgi:hypothetical protein
MARGHLPVASGFKLLAKGKSEAFLGGVAQLGERRLCKPEVIGSSPFTSTRHISLALY